MWHAMRVTKESVSEMEWADGMEIGASPVLRGSSLAEKLQSGLPSKSGFCLICASLCPCYLSFSTFSSFYSIVTSPPPLLGLLFHSASRSFSPYSVRLGTVKNAASDSPSSWVRSLPPHCIDGLLGLIPLQMILFLFETKRTDPYLYYSSCRDCRGGFRKKNLFLQESCG